MCSFPYRVAIIVIVVSRVCAFVHGLIAAGGFFLLLGLFLCLGGGLSGAVEIIVFLVHCGLRSIDCVRRAECLVSRT